MITIINLLDSKYVDQNGTKVLKQLVELALKSTDTKPTNCINGSTCIEVDTGKLYIFDESASAWTEIGG